MPKRITLEMIRKAVQQLQENEPKQVCEHNKKGMIELLFTPRSKKVFRIYCEVCGKEYKSKKEGNTNV